MSYEIYERIIKEKGYNSAAVSRATGISQTTFSEWKKGKSEPKADKLKKIADFLGVTMEFLTTGENPDGYYYDKESAQLAQEIYQDRDLHMLFDAAKGSSAKELRDFADMIKLMRRREQGED